MLTVGVFCLQAGSSGDNGVPPAVPPAALVDSIEMPYNAPTGADTFWTSLKLSFALPWRRFKKGSVLTIKVSSTCLRSRS